MYKNIYTNCNIHNENIHFTVNLPLLRLWAVTVHICCIFKMPLAQKMASCVDRRPNFETFKEPKNRFQGTNSARLWSLTGRYDKLIPARFLAPINCFKIPSQMVYLTSEACAVPAVVQCFQRLVRDWPGQKQTAVVGVLDEPYSAKPAQRSNHTGPPGYIEWTRFQPL